MFGKFGFLLLFLCILVVSVDGHHRCKPRRKRCKCSCDEEQSSYTNVPTVSTSMPPFSPSTEPATSISTAETTIRNPHQRHNLGDIKPCTESCPAGWKLYDHYCYKGIYKGYNTQAYYNGICARSNSNLVSIHSAKENDFVGKLAASSGKPPHGIWIGLIFVNGANTITSPKYWTDNKSKYLTSADYGYARDRFPWDVKDKTPAKCNVMWISSKLHPRGEWDDIKCKDTGFANAAVCKQPSKCGT